MEDISFWTISGWLIALLSLCVNTLQLLKNNELKKKITNTKQKVGDNSTSNQQAHSGTGHNVNSQGNVRL